MYIVSSEGFAPVKQVIKAYKWFLLSLSILSISVFSCENLKVLIISMNVYLANPSLLLY